MHAPSSRLVFGGLFDVPSEVLYRRFHISTAPANTGIHSIEPHSRVAH